MQPTGNQAGSNIVDVQESELRFGEGLSCKIESHLDRPANVVKVGNRANIACGKEHFDVLDAVAA